MYTPNVVNYNKGSLEGECVVKAYTSLDQNYFNYNDFNNKAKDYPFAGVVPSGPATGSWPSEIKALVIFLIKIIQLFQNTFEELIY